MARAGRFGPGPALATALAAGVLAGVVAAAFLSVAGEPAIEDAIALEQAAAHPGDQAAHAGDELVSRAAQRGPGLFAAYGLSGAAFGLLLGASWLGLGAAGQRPDPFRRALLAGAILAGAVTVSPWLKYPPNPPAVGDPATLASRQALHAALVVLTAAVLLGAAWASGRLRAAGWADHRRLVAVGGGVVATLLVAFALLPGGPDPAGVPAALLWRFRVASLGGNLLLWGTLAAGFGLLAAERAGGTRPGGAVPVGERRAVGAGRP